MFNIEFAFL